MFYLEKNLKYNTPTLIQTRDKEKNEGRKSRIKLKVNSKPQQNCTNCISFIFISSLRKTYQRKHETFQWLFFKSGGINQTSVFFLVNNFISDRNRIETSIELADKKKSH